MKLRLTFRFLVLSVLAAGAFSVLSVHNAKAQGGTFCQSTYNWCLDDAAVPLNAVINDPNSTQQQCNDAWRAYWRSNAACDSTQQGCFSENAWQDWLIQYNGNINSDPEMIQEGPDPICAMYPDIIVGCGSLPTAEEIEACVMMAQQEQAKFHCP